MKPAENLTLIAIRKQTVSEIETRNAIAAELADAEVRFSPIAEDGSLEGWATRFNTPDAYRTSFDPAAFQWDGQRLPLLWSHDPSQVIGSVRSVATEAEGLKITAKLNLGVQRAQEVRAMLLDGDVSGLSIGFRRLRDEVRQGGIRHITQARLVEVSLVAVPAVPGSRVTSTRAIPDTSLAAFLETCRAATISLKGH